MLVFGEDSELNIEFNKEILSEFTNILTFFDSAGFVTKDMEEEDYENVVNKAIETIKSFREEHNYEYNIDSLVGALSHIFEYLSVEDFQKNKKFLMYLIQQLKRIDENNDSKHLNVLVFKLYDRFIYHLSANMLKENFKSFITSDEELIQDIAYYPVKLLSDICMTLLTKEKLSLLDNLLNIIFDGNKKFEYREETVFNTIFGDIFRTIEWDKIKLNEIQLELLLKWSNHTEKKDFYDNKINSLKISKSSDKKQKEIELIETLKKDIIKYRNEISGILTKLCTKKDVLATNIAINLIDEYYDPCCDKYDYAEALFRIIDSVIQKNFDGILERKNIVDKILDIALLSYNNAKGTDEHIQTHYFILFCIANKLLNEKKFNIALTFIKDMMTKDGDISDKSTSYETLEYLIKNMGSAESRVHLDILEESINFFDNETLKELFNTNSNLWKVKHDESDINVYMLSDEFKNDVNNNDFINYTILQLIKSANKVDFESIMEYLIKNKKHFEISHFNCIDFYFQGLITADSLETFKKIIDNNTIKTELKKIFQNFNVDEYYSYYDNTNYQSSIVKNGLFKLLIDNNETTDLLLELINIIDDKNTKEYFISFYSLIRNYSSNECYNNSADIESLNEEMLKYLKNDLLSEELLKLYYDFITKVFETNYKYGVKLLIEYRNSDNFKHIDRAAEIDNIMVNVFNKYGYLTFKEILLFDTDFKNIYLSDIDYKIDLIVSAKDNNDTSEVINILQLLFDNMTNLKSDFIKKMLHSTRYRQIITLEELDYIDSLITDIKNEETKKQLERKSELLRKKLGTSNS